MTRPPWQLPTLGWPSQPPPARPLRAVADVILLSDNGAEALPFLLQVAHDTKSVVRQVCQHDFPGCSALL